MGELAITPNRAVARRLQVPYRSLRGLAEELLEEQGRAVCPPFLSRTLLKRAVAEVLAPRDPLGLAAAMEAGVRTLLRLDADLDRVAQSPLGRLSQLARVARRYRQLLASRGWLDPAQVFPEATRLLRPERARQLAVRVAFRPYLGQGEAPFLKALAQTGARVQVELLLPPGPLGEANAREAQALREAQVAVQALGLSPLGEAFLAGRGTGGLQALAFPDMAQEVRYALVWAKGRLLEGVAPERIALVVRDDRRYGPLVRAVGYELDLPVRLFYRIPVAETRVGGLLLLLGEVLPAFPFEATLRLLTHPLLPEAYRAGLDLGRAQSRRPEGPRAWEGVGLKGRLLEAPPEGEEARGWLGQLLRELRPKVAPWPREALALEAVEEGLGELKGEPDPLRHLGELLFHLTVPAQLGYGGLEVHTPLAGYGGRYTHLLVLGMAEGLTPAPVGEDPLLGLREGEALQEMGVAWEPPWQAYFREALVFASLLGGVEEGEVVLTYPQVVGSTPAPPSPFLRRLGLEPQSPGARPLSRREARWYRLWEGDPLRERMEQALRLESSRQCKGGGEGSSPGGDGGCGDGHIGEPFRPGELWVNHLEDLRVCPFRFLLKGAYGLGRDQEAGEGVGAGEGAFVHRVLRRLLEQAQEEGGAGDIRQVAKALLEEVFSREEELAKEEYPFLRHRAWAYRRGDLLRLLREVLEDPHFLPEGSEILALEVTVTGSLPPLGGVTLKGRIDRVDRRRHNLYLVDYRYSRRVDTDDVQLPLSAWLYRVHGDGARAPRDPAGGYYLLRRDQKRLQSMRGTRGQLEDFLREVGERLERGHFPPRPGEACRGCEAALVCRAQVTHPGEGGGA